MTALPSIAFLLILFSAIVQGVFIFKKTFQGDPVSHWLLVAAALFFLLSHDETKKNDFDRLTYTAIAVGYPIFTSGAMIFGAIWAQQAWGTWWSWDPKETWALATWLVYSLYLHMRFIHHRKDTLPAIIAVIGFLCTVFTFFGVNFLLSGLHSYG